MIEPHHQPRPQGFSLIFWGESPGDKVGPPLIWRSAAATDLRTSVDSRTLREYSFGHLGIHNWIKFVTGEPTTSLWLNIWFEFEADVNKLDKSLNNILGSDKSLSDDHFRHCVIESELKEFTDFLSLLFVFRITARTKKSLLRAANSAI